MATRSMIGIMTEKGEIRAIYCHYDGYPEHNGALLLEHYNTPERINALIDLGAISVLAENLEPLNEVEIPYYSYGKPTTEPVPHSFQTPHEATVIAYHRDRGEDLQIDKFLSERLFNIDRKRSWTDYGYLYKDGKWYVNSRELTRKMCGLEEIEEEQTQDVA